MAKKNGLWASGDRRTVATESWWKKHPDGTLEVYRVDTVQVVGRNKRFACIKHRSLGFPMMVVHPLGQHRRYYEAHQLLYYPGDTMHNNGEMAELFSYSKIKAPLVKGGFTKGDKVPQELMPSSIL